MTPPPVPDFLTLNGTPDTRPPGPRDPESQLPPIPHIPGTPEPWENTHTKNMVIPQEPGIRETGEHLDSVQITPPFLEVPTEVTNKLEALKGARFSDVAVDTPGSKAPRDPAFQNYPGAGKEPSETQLALEVLARANIRAPLPGGLMHAPNLEHDFDFRMNMDEKNKVFLRVLEKTGRITKAAEVAGMSRNGFRMRKTRDPIFARLWDDAMKNRAELFEDEAIRRAVGGTTKNIYYMGSVVGTEKVYSDSLLIRLMEGNMPEKYRQNHKIELEGKMAVATMILPATTSAEEWAAQNSGTIIEQEPEDEYA